MHSSVSKTSALIIAGLLSSGIAQAALYVVDPGPYTPANAKFPAWYQDTHGRALDLCLSRAVSSRAAAGPEPAYMCGLLPEPGVYDDTQPFAFPGNFPHEAFWFTAGASIVDAPTGISLDFGSALEAAFSGDGPIDGDQVSFSRIRIRVDVSTPGIYTVTHPYGVDVFDVTVEDINGDGVRAINMTRDIGIASDGLFSGALAGDVGPFLRSVNGPYSETNPDTGLVESYIGDPNIEEEVTGSPFATNYVRIEGPNGIDLRTNLFAVTGLLSNVALPTPLKIDRATYSRHNGEEGIVARQDVFALAPPPPGSVGFSDTSGTSNVMSEEDTTGNWYGQSSAAPTVPGNISVTADNSLAIPGSSASTVQAPIVDQVIIHRAEYRLSTAQLTVEAESSDKTGSLVMSVIGNNGPIGDLSGSGAIKQLVTSITPIPPARIDVMSSNGGVDVEDVIILP